MNKKSESQVAAPSPIDILFDSAVEQIQAAYANLGHRRGWRFLASPRGTLKADGSCLVLTPNPAGAGPEPNQGEASCEFGSAYLYESWEGAPPGAAPLQQQMQMMYAWLGRDPDETLSAYFVPFRSGSLNDLVSKQESLKFAEDLWYQIFNEIAPRLIVCLGRDVEGSLRYLMGPPIEATNYSVGWGDQTARPQKATISRHRGCVVLVLPHLSRFQIFGREEGRVPLEVLRAALEVALQQV